MSHNCEYLSYESTGSFSKLLTDYVKGDTKLSSFYKHPVSLEGIKSAIEERKQFNTNRTLLVEELRKQYKGLTLSQRQEENLNLLANSNTFTICTAHQPVIFTGPLYFIYKVIHTIKLADHLKDKFTDCNFVPVFYMGSEDADLDELGHTYVNGQKLEWKTDQTGAVGRMKVDKELVAVIDQLAGELEVTEQGKELIALFRRAYNPGTTIQDATLVLLQHLFKDFGLLVLIPDNAALKKQFNYVIKKELQEQFSHPLVEETCKSLGEHYKQQASGRELNLFYLKDNKRERIEKVNDRFSIVGEKIEWSLDEILAEVDQQPQNFSANVILRGVFQETVLPNIAFIGGGGEIAYWLELKKVFEAVNVPFPMLVVRNSFMLLNKPLRELTEKLAFKTLDLFKDEMGLINSLVIRESELQLTLADEKEELLGFYNKLQKVAGNTDVTLAEHTANLRKRAVEKLEALEKKMVRAEKRKFEAQQRQIRKLKQSLFPNGSLQERVENFSSFYSKYGYDFLQQIYQASLSLEQQFAVVHLD